MHSKHAFTLALMAGAGALLVVLGCLLYLEFLEAAEPYLNGREDKPVETDATTEAPQFTTKIEGSAAQIAEIDKNGQTVRVIYSSDLNDQIADFSLFAVPQTRYDGKIYVQSVQDAEGNTLIVYPLNVNSGTLAPASLNIASQYATVSPDQDRVAVITTTLASNITAYDLTNGAILASWTLNANEKLSEGAGYSRAYTGSGVRWTSNSCFDHAVWVDNLMEIRTFCIEVAN